AYVGEDLFVDTHRALLADGFFLSDLRVGATVRMRRETLSALQERGFKASPPGIEPALKPSPVYCEARYLRSLTWLAERGLGTREHLLLWVFALLDGQAGYALDVVRELD